MRDRFEATGASVPGGQAYAQVMEELRKTSGGDDGVGLQPTSRLYLSMHIIRLFFRFCFLCF